MQINSIQDIEKLENLSGQELAEVLIQAGELADIKNPWRGDGWPAGWCAALDRLISSCQDVQPILDELENGSMTELLETTVCFAMLQKGLATKEQLQPDIDNLAEHCVHQIEFEGSSLRPFYELELNVIKANWPGEWAYAISEAASEATNMCFDVYAPVAEILEHSESQQKSQILSRHSGIQVEPGMDIFDIHKVIEILRGCDEELYEDMLFLPEDLLEEKRVLMSALRAATYGTAFACLAQGKIYPRGFNELWEKMLQYDLHLHKYLWELKSTLPLEDLPKVAELIRSMPDPDPVYLDDDEEIEMTYSEDDDEDDSDEYGDDYED